MQVRRSLEGEMAGPVFQPGTPILPIIELDYEVLCWGVVCHRGGMSGGHYTQGDQGAARFDKNKTECASGPVTAYMASHVSTNWASEGCKAPALSRATALETMGEVLLHEWGRQGAEGKRRNVKRTPEGFDDSRHGHLICDHLQIAQVYSCEMHSPL